MRTLVIGDIHGGLKALIQVLNKAEIKDKDRLIFVGDYVDGWSESAQVIQFLIDISKRINCVFLKGNHDVWCEEWLHKGEVNPTWYVHGGKETMESYEGFSTVTKEEHLSFFQNMPLYHIDEDNRLFIHAGFTSMHGVKKEAFKASFNTDRTLWEMAFSMDKTIDKTSETYPKRLRHYSEIYIGHTPTIHFNSDQPINVANVWNVDTGAAFTGKISILDIDTKAVFQSDTLPSLYPDEKGRNK